jgi:DNA-binding LacI/PurR family transcriptional regulator
MEGLIKTAKQLNYDIKIEPFFDPEKPEALLKSFGPPYSDGVIFIGPEDFQDVIQATSARGLPCILLCTEPSGFEKIPEISFDLNPGISAAVDALVKKKRKKVAFIGPSALDFSKSHRFAVFIKFLKNAGIYSEDLFFALKTMKELRAVIAKYKKAVPFDAVVCHNDTMASYLINELEENSINVPHDVSVIGFDDNPVYKNLNLSTISLSRFEIGKHTVELLINIIEGQTIFNDKKFLASSFTGGATC